MTYSFQMQELLKKHEDFKKRGLKLTADDLFQRNMVLEALLDLRVEKRSQLLEEKNKLDNEKAIKRLIYKDQKSEDGKKLHTEGTIDAMLSSDFFSQDREYLLLKGEIEMLENKIAVIPEYIQLAKRFLPSNF